MHLHWKFLHGGNRRSCALKRCLLRDFIDVVVHVRYLSWSVHPVYRDCQLSFRGRVTKMQSQRFRRQNRTETDEVSLKQMPVNWYKSQGHVQKDLLSLFWLSVRNDSRPIKCTQLWNTLRIAQGDFECRLKVNLKIRKNVFPLKTKATYCSRVTVLIKSKRLKFISLIIKQSI